MRTGERFDVLVAGGGLAGIAAAVTAARLGARTLLAERTQALGGNATSALVHTLCGLYAPADGDGAPLAGGGPGEGSAAPPHGAGARDAAAVQRAAAPEIVHPGFPRRLVARLAAAGGAGVPERAGRVWVLPIFPPVLEAVVTRWCQESPGLETRTRCGVVGAELAGGGDAPSVVTLDTRGRRSEIEARRLVDASGDAALAHLGGAAVETPPLAERQACSFVFRLWNARPADALAGFERLRLTHAIAGAARRRRLPPGCASVLLRPGQRPGEAYVTLNLPFDAARPLDPLVDAERERLERRAHRLAQRLLAFLRAERAGFERAEIAAWPRRVGVRETRRLRGRTTVSRDDVLLGRRPADEVALSTWPVERWDDHTRARFAWPEAPSGVPLGALVSATHPVLAAAGRCLSADRDALAALRVLGTAMATGEAAGAAAALAADAGCDLTAIDAARVRAAIAGLAQHDEAA